VAAVSDREEELADDEQSLGELFVEVTGQTEVTERRVDPRGKGVVEPEDGDDGVAVDAESLADGLEDAIGQGADDSA
jgi:hypothetical protein